MLSTEINLRENKMPILQNYRYPKSKMIEISPDSLDVRKIRKNKYEVKMTYGYYVKSIKRYDCLFISGNEVVFSSGKKKYYLKDIIKAVHVKGKIFNKLNFLTNQGDVKIIYIKPIIIPMLDYIVDIIDPIGDPWWEEEMGDFYLFVANVCNDKERQKRIIKARTEN